MADTIIIISDDTIFDPEHDERQEFLVTVCDADDGDAVGDPERFTTEGAAGAYAHEIARGREVHWE